MQALSLRSLCRSLVVVLVAAQSIALVASAQMPKNPMAMDPMAAAGAPQRTLDSGEVDRYLAALDGLVQAGVDSGRELGANPSDARRQAAGIEYSSKVMDIIDDHGFDQQTFSEVHWNLMFAYAAVEMDGKQGEIDEAHKKQMAQLEAMKGSMPPEQYEAMMQSVGRMNAFMDTYKDVPEANKALVRKNKAKIDAILEKAE